MKTALLKPFRPAFCLSAALLFPASLALAQAPDVTALIQQLQGLGAVTAPSSAAFAQALDALLPDMGSGDLAKQGAAQNTWEKIALRAGRPGAEAERAAAVAAMLPKVGSQTPLPTRLWMLKQIESIGRAEAVPTLVKLLDDAEPQVAERARRALSNNPSPQAALALQSALASAATTEKRIALVDAIGYRRDASAVPALNALLNGGDSGVIGVALGALGRIATPDAMKDLTAYASHVPATLRTAAIDAELSGAERLLARGDKAGAAAVYTALYAPGQAKGARLGALRGLVAARGANALPVLTAALGGSDDALREVAANSIELLPASATPALAALVPKLTPDGQVALLNALGTRGDAAARSAALAAAASKTDAVRIAALGALGTLGNKSDVALLSRLAATASGDVGDAARDSLNRLRGADVQNTLLEALPGADAKTRVVLIRALTSRRALPAIPVLLQQTKDADGTVRLESLNALGELASDRDASALVQALGAAKSDDERAAAEKALTSLVNRATSKDAISTPVLAALAGADTPTRVSLFHVLRATGTDPALGGLRLALKDPDAAVQEAAVRALADWPGANAAADLIDLAKTSNNQIFQVLSLRGYVRLVGLSNHTPGEKVDMYQSALAASKRPDEKKLAIAGLGELSDVAALQTVAPLLDDADLREEAAAAATKIAKAVGGGENGVKPVLQKVVQVAKTKETVQAAADILRTNSQPHRQWQIAGPFPGGNAAFDTAFEPEKGVDLGKTYTITGNQTAGWKTVTSNDTGYIDLNATLQPNQSVVAYAVIYVKSPDARKVTVSAGSDDGLKLWVNGGQIISHNAERPAVAGSDEAPAQLKAGWNEVLLKITQGSGDWGFYCDFVDDNHLPVEGLTFAPQRD